MARYLLLSGAPARQARSVFSFPWKGRGRSQPWVKNRPRPSRGKNEPGGRRVECMEESMTTTTTPTPRNETVREEADLYRASPELTSVVSYPQRCNRWGDARYRGNCDGSLFKELVLRYRCKRVADPMMGSGTTRDVIAGLNRNTGTRIRYWGGDLRMGFDLYRERPKGTFDLVWLHPPYFNIIDYGGGEKDLSSDDHYPRFLTKLTVCLRNCYEVLEPGGHLAVLVADVRRAGCYYPLGRDVMNMEPCLGDIRSVIVKSQHNCKSDGINYARMKHPPIKHEYCVVFEKTG